MTLPADFNGFTTPGDRTYYDRQPCSSEELERKAFEEWYLAQWKGQWSFAKNKTIADVEKLRGEDGDYSEYPYTQGCWLGWQARAKQESNDGR